MHLQSQTYEQRPHCCADQTIDPVLTLSLHDGGGGWYIVLDATAWALDDAAEIQALADAAKALLAQAPKEGLGDAISRNR